MAAVLGCLAGNVKSQSARSLDKLRVVLGETMHETGSPDWVPGERQERGDTARG